MLLYVYNKWMKASGFQRWIWLRPSWRFYLWLGVAVISFVAALFEVHAFAAIANASFLHNKHLALLLVTTFIRDFLIGLCAVAITAKMLGFGSSRQPRPHAPP